MSQKTPPPDINLVSYRLREIESNLEKNIEKLSAKIDLILTEINKTTVVQSENKIKVEKLEADVINLIKTDEAIKEDVVKLKVSIAEKLSWGALGGSISAIIIKLIGTNGG
jgi:hypothetical protein